MLRVAKPQGPVVIQIMKIKDEDLGKYMYSPSIIFLMDKDRGMAFGVRTDIYTGVLATAVTETLKNTAMLFSRIYPTLELYDAETEALIERFDLNDDDIIKQFLPLEMLQAATASLH